MGEYFELFKDIGEVLGLGIHFSRLAFLFVFIQCYSNYTRTVLCSHIFNLAIANLSIVTLSKSYSKMYTFRKYISLWGLIERISVSEKYVISCFFVFLVALIIILNAIVFLLADIKNVHLYGDHYFQLIIVFSIFLITAGGAMVLLYLLTYSSLVKNMTDLMLIIKRKHLFGKLRILIFFFSTYFSLNFIIFFFYIDHEEKSESRLNTTRFLQYISDKTVLENNPLSATVWGFQLNGPLIGKVLYLGLYSLIIVITRFIIQQRVSI